MTLTKLEVKLTYDVLEALGLGGESPFDVDGCHFEGKTLEVGGQLFTLAGAWVQALEFPCGCCGTEYHILHAVGMSA